MDEVVKRIQRNIEEVRGKIQQAAVQSGRSASDIRLIVVTKRQPVDLIRAAIDAGAELLGENYPEEAVEKINALQPLNHVEWHMIGHLQSRKARLVVQHFNYLHSLDSLSLALKLEKLLSEAGRKLPVLLELNVSGEGSKSGWPAWNRSQWDDLLLDIEKLAQLPHLEISGIMTMPPLLENPEQVQPFFARLRAAKEYFESKFPEIQWKELSMGTSADFIPAIREGATFIRVGQAILGPRPPK